MPHVVEIDPQQDPRWAAFVAAHPDALIYHHPAWLQVLVQAYGYTIVGLACEHDDGQLQGILPLAYKPGWLTGRRVSSLPHAPQAGPLTYDDQATARLVRAAIARVSAVPTAWLELRVPRPRLDRSVAGLGCARESAVYVRALPPEPDALRFGTARNHAAIKRAVNKATQLGVQVRPAETEADLRAWYRLYLDTMRWHVAPPHAYRFFTALWDLLRPCHMMRLLLAEQCGPRQRRLLAGSLYLMAGQTVLYAFNGRQQAALSLRPNDAIHWQALQDACGDGFRHYDFGDVLPGNDGLVQYKRKWGSEPRPIYTYHYPALQKNPVGGEAAGPPQWARPHCTRRVAAPAPPCHSARGHLAVSVPVKRWFARTGRAPRMSTSSRGFCTGRTCYRICTASTCYCMGKP